ncbi:hypothetical protein RRG08_065310 [Elysia crispata]|uniref:Uncharacterized protein n=1 Tax=Elysia crispata TaxID=231223 RepID=A0AAE0ZU93_9GAST|nr:hypothetical protein RRG08_065310 [Elysia crispata]
MQQAVSTCRLRAYVSARQTQSVNNNSDDSSKKNRQLSLSDGRYWLPDVERALITDSDIVSECKFSVGLGRLH